jgi:hypothetical protein
VTCVRAKHDQRPEGMRWPESGRTPPRNRSGGHRRLTREEKGIETCVRTEQEQRPESGPATGVRELYG